MIDLHCTALSMVGLVLIYGLLGVILGPASFLILAVTAGAGETWFLLLHAFIPGFRDWLHEGSILEGDSYNHE